MKRWCFGMMAFGVRRGRGIRQADVSMIGENGFSEASGVEGM